MGQRNAGLSCRVTNDNSWPFLTQKLKDWLMSSVHSNAESLNEEINSLFGNNLLCHMMSGIGDIFCVVLRYL